MCINLGWLSSSHDIFSTTKVTIIIFLFDTMSNDMLKFVYVHVVRKLGFFIQMMFFSVMNLMNLNIFLQ